MASETDTDLVAHGHRVCPVTTSPDRLQQSMCACTCVCACVHTNGSGPKSAWSLHGSQPFPRTDHMFAYTRMCTHMQKPDPLPPSTTQAEPSVTPLPATCSIPTHIKHAFCWVLLSAFPDGQAYPTTPCKAWGYRWDPKYDGL